MIPYYVVSGTYYEVGKLVGERFRDVIRQYYEIDVDFVEIVFPFVQTISGKKVYNDFLTAVQRQYPQYVEEIQGLADGAGLTFEQVFTMHLSRELRIAVQVKQEWGCSDLFINYPETSQVALGHNEDIDPLVKTRAYVVHVTVQETNPSTGDKIIKEDFTAYTYPGHLPGSAFSFNSAGMVFNCNGLPPELISYGKIPRYILNRAMIKAASPEEFEKILMCDGIGSAYGFSVNLVQINPRMAVSMWNYEIAPVADQPTTSIHRVSIGPDGACGFDYNGYYFHCNKYKYEHMTTPQIERLMRSSKGRMSRFAELSAPRTLDDVINVLEDDTAVDYPIFRTPSSTDRNATVCTAIYDFVSMTVNIYEDKPTVCVPDLSLKLPSGELD